MVFNYKQSDEPPYLQITIDDNLLDYMDIYVENKTLIIAPKKNKGGIRSYNISPTRCIINTNSTLLTHLVNAGSGNVNLLSNIKSEKLIFSISGSGNVTCPNTVSVDQLDIMLSGSGGVSLNGEANNCRISVTGSGEVVCPNSLSTDQLTIVLSGSGNVALNGNANNCKISIAGSGGVESYQYSVKDLTCSISGSGSVKLHVENTITCSIAGSGTLRYTGNPTISKQSIAGSGKIIKQSSDSE
jgi:hypothetical protein